MFLRGSSCRLSDSRSTNTSRTSTFNRLEAYNSLSFEVIVRLAEAWQEIDKDDDVRAVVVTGSGQGGVFRRPDFGRLIPLFTRARQPEDEGDRKLLANRGLSDIAQLRGYDCTKPAIAAINGFCIAGGMEFIQSTCVPAEPVTVTGSRHRSLNPHRWFWALCHMLAARSCRRLGLLRPTCVFRRREASLRRIVAIASLHHLLEASPA